MRDYNSLESVQVSEPVEEEGLMQKTKLLLSFYYSIKYD